MAAIFCYTEMRNGGGFMKINKKHGSYNISKRTESVKYIVVHYASGTNTPREGTARDNCIFFGTGYRDASAHYFIDDGGIWEYADPKKYFTWHCGDGHGRYGITNSNSIGIEVCQRGDNPFTAKEITYLKELVMSLMKKYKVPADRVVRHFDASRKQCPYYYVRRPNEWKALRKTITGQSTVKPTVPTSTVKAKSGYKGTFPSLGTKGYLSYGDKGSNVSRLQQFLNWFGGYNLKVDGSFGPATKAAVVKFQKAIWPNSSKMWDGYFGPSCLSKAKSIKK